MPVSSMQDHRSCRRLGPGGVVCSGWLTSKSGDAPWELIVQECSADLSYRAWRKPLRGGLYLYKTHAVVERAAPADVRAFHMDDLAR